MPNIDKIRVNGIDYNVVAPEIYDDQERVIGTWFGKPLYRKVITGIIDNSATNWQVLATISELNIDTLMITTANLIEYNDGKYRVVHELPYHDRAIYERFVHLFDSKGSNVEILVPSNYINDFINNKVIVIIEYTKTTDIVE